MSKILTKEEVKDTALYKAWKLEQRQKDRYRIPLKPLDIKLRKRFGYITLTKEEIQSWDVPTIIAKMKIPEIREALEVFFTDRGAHFAMPAVRRTEQLLKQADEESRLPGYFKFHGQLALHDRPEFSQSKTEDFVRYFERKK